ncbi:MAG: ferrochelatase [Lactobacillus sp.]|nr:ferrochelatase [Lactobacillus sp.]
MSKNQKGILLINLGTPSDPSVPAVTKFLRRFLSDRRVIHMLPLLWQPILNLMVLPKHAPKSAANYERLWSSGIGSPLLHYTQRQAQLLAKRLPEYTVRYAMSYSQPLIGAVLKEFEFQGITDLTIIPLYPQYSTTTTASVQDDVARFYQDRKTVPEIRFVSDYSSFWPYIKALSNKLQKAILKVNPDAIVFSYHGIPLSYQKAGDPYAQRCRQTTMAVIERLGLSIPCFQSYQSRFGPAEWLKPATKDLLTELPKQGYQKVLVVAPSFVSDCLETIQELGEENRDAFLTAGGREYQLLPALNDDPEWIEALAQLTLLNAVMPAQNTAMDLPSAYLQTE